MFYRHNSSLIGFGSVGRSESKQMCSHREKMKSACRQEDWRALARELQCRVAAVSSTRFQQSVRNPRAQLSSCSGSLDCAVRLGRLDSRLNPAQISLGKASFADFE